MAKAIRIVLFVLGGLVALLVAAVVAILLFVDPNDYRDDIGRAVQRATGRELAIGAIDLSLYPWLGVRLRQAELGNAPGFEGPFARMEEVDVRVRLLPLLRRDVEVSNVVLRGLALNLGRDARGAGNWEDLTRPAPESVEEKPEQQAKTGAPAISSLAIGGVEIVDARVVWDDRQAGARQEISEFDLRSSSIALDRPFDLSLSFNAASDAPPLKAQVALRTRVAPDLAQRQFQLQGLALEVNAQSRELIPLGAVKARLAGDVSADLGREQYRVKGLVLDVDTDGKGELPLGPLQARLAAEVAADLAAQSLHVSGLRLSALGVQLDGEARGERILEDIALSGTLRSNTFSARELLDKLGIKLQTADPKALSQAALELGFKAGAGGAAVEGLKARLDDTTLSGSASVSDFARPAIRFALKLDALDADRYLPPPAPAAAAPAAASAPAAPLELPMETLRGLNVEGSLGAGRIKISNVKLSELSATIKAREGVLALSPVAARLYDGGFQGAVQLDARQDVPVFRLDEKLAGVKIGPLLKDLLDLDLVEGTADVESGLTTRGLTVAALKSALDGSGKFVLNDGAVKGINIVYEVEKARALLKGESAPPREANKTDFAELKGGFTVKGGVVDNQDLQASAPLLRVRGKGSADLNAETLDYRVDVSVVATLKGQGGKALDELRGLTVPLRIHGPFAEPKVRVELDKALKGKAEAAIEKEKQKIEERVEKKLDEKREELKQEAGEKAKEQLKKLLKF